MSFRMGTTVESFWRKSSSPMFLRKLVSLENISEFSWSELVEACKRVFVTGSRRLFPASVVAWATRHSRTCFSTCVIKEASLECLLSEKTKLFATRFFSSFGVPSLNAFDRNKFDISCGVNVASHSLVMRFSSRGNKSVQVAGLFFNQVRSE